MIDPSLRALLAAREYDPFRALGLHRTTSGWILRVLRPHALSIDMECAEGQYPLHRVEHTDLFEWRGSLAPSMPYRLHIRESERSYTLHDAYAFTPQASEHDIFLFGAGKNSRAYNLLGAHSQIRQGVAGVCFRVWAPNAERVSVVGDFNRWDGRTHAMGCLGGSGIWELFIPDLGPGDLYKFEIRNRASGNVCVKSDPYARATELRPATAARVVAPSNYAWQDNDWLAARAQRDWLHAPMSVYEVHAGSWMRHADGSFYSYRQLAERLVPYVQQLGYTHIEFLPLMEHPLDESWGYQCTGFFAPSARFGTPDDMRFLVDQCHQAGIGVILDWVPGHFPADEWALARFDGSALYEHADPRQGKHPDWGTLVFNYGRNEIRSFLLSSAAWWLEEFHADALRVDAVASMLYLDYSRKKGEWLPNRYGGRENLEAISFVRELNEMVHRDFPGALTIAEESTAWPQVSRPVYVGGLGFSMKWNMGWMNDTLAYFTRDPVHRRFHHDRLTFGQLYAYSENFTLPFSHDEVVHGKRSLLGKMPGDEWQRFANLRLLLAYQMAMPGKKLNFMGNEIGQGHEWRAHEEIAWHLLQWAPHQGIQKLAADLNQLYRETPALYEQDFAQSGFAWIDCNDTEQSVLSWLRFADDGSYAVVIANFTPVPRMAYRIGVPDAANFREVLNTDSAYYGGSNMGNANHLMAEDLPWMNRPASLQLTLPPLALVVLIKG